MSRTGSRTGHPRRYAEPYRPVWEDTDAIDGETVDNRTYVGNEDDKGENEPSPGCSWATALVVLIAIIVTVTLWLF
ncbi:MAG: hypothetical protein NZ699_09430 [Roseiflexus sp.]|nr:hypothetical protein [Roseiflexus sp.]MDW8146401.1 hypothetical protein [Roseiflexaceae bacterium]